MKTLSEILSQITAPDEAARAACLARWDGLAKPLGSLGLLEASLARIAAVTGSPDITLDRRTLLVLCADNGVVAQGVAQCGSSVTASVAQALAAGESTVCHMARCARCRVIPVDMGMADFPSTPGVWDRRVRNGTADITQGPAMTRAECVQAIELGAELVRECHESGSSIIATGEMGIGNTTTSSALASVLLGKSPAEVTGRGAGLSDAGLTRKVAAIERALSLNRPDPADPVDIISKVGGLDIAGLCGVFLGGALYRVPVVIDGFISGAAALCAARLCPGATFALLASHVSAEPAGGLMLDALELSPLISAGMRLGEGSGAVAALPLLDMALAVYHSGQTFGRLGIDAYTPQ
ncbi:nicotinate-nucleotide--dimethylbenzimidazole phosphoribosyltransferase [uncultured Oscillibacter sp.]|uniref:nicotinate-nucleotide--dimethylbenzimidazole phosphoribosyltransferase n=1 Tax=uncultured Oscillibacter sp. TaxID=876091 RepID=UPI0025CD8355|nr:nicotinate-nucleotide--dimethylbenzimidazole phosphoribosyltransferase [uncultured Oscillibacter sp.]